MQRSYVEVGKMISKLKASPEFEDEDSVVDAIVDALEWALYSDTPDSRILDFLEN